MLPKKKKITSTLRGWLVTEKFTIGKEGVEICQSLEVQSASNVHNIFCLYVFENKVSVQKMKLNIMLEYSDKTTFFGLKV